MSELILKYRLDTIIKTLLFLIMASFLSYSILELIKIWTNRNIVSIQLFISINIFSIIIFRLTYILTKFFQITLNKNRLLIYTILASLFYFVSSIKPDADKSNFIGLKSYIVTDDEPTDGEVDLSDNGVHYELFGKFDKRNILNRIKNIKTENKDYEIEIVKEYFLFPQTAILYGYKTIRVNNDVYKIKVNFFDSLYIVFEWFINGIRKYLLLFLLFKTIESLFVKRQKIKSFQFTKIKSSASMIYSNELLKTFIFIVLLNIVVWSLLYIFKS